MSRALRSILVVVALFAAGSFASACSNMPTDIVQAEDGSGEETPGDGYNNNN